jgi:hypothetical protein
MRSCRNKKLLGATTEYLVAAVIVQHESCPVAFPKQEENDASKG